MNPFNAATFFTSSLIVPHNAIKNVIFRAATIVLEFMILRIFGLFAFRCGDYTSFLMFPEDLMQKALFMSSRGITARQSLLVGMFALIAAGGEFYDTLLWAIDNPGFIMHHSMVPGATLASQMVNKPTYVVTVSANVTNPSEIDNVNTSFNTNLYNPGLNYTLPGVFQLGEVEVVPPLYPLNPYNGTARIWLDDEGFAVGLDYTFMQTINMSRSVDTGCVPFNTPNETVIQAWNCNVPNGDAMDMLDMSQGSIPIWWDVYHQDWLTPYPDNPWAAYGTGGGTVMMKQIFTVTKGHRRHTFMSAVFKATMSASAPETLDDGEIADFIVRTWSTDGSTTTGIQDLINVVLYAKGNNTGRTFGELVQANTSVLSMSTDFLNIANVTGSYFASVLRFTLVNTTLIRSETLAEEPTPLEPCPGTVYHNIAKGGVASSTDCNLPLINQTLPLNQNPFLGQVDTSAVAIFADFLGDGTSAMSSVALSPTGVDWAAQQADHIDKLLISRALLMGGNASTVMVDVGNIVPAMSGLQLLLCVVPAVLAIMVWYFTHDPALSYYQNSFLSAVLATTHTTATHCKELGYIRSMPEITLRKRGRHVTLGTPHEGTILNTVSMSVADSEMAYEPLVLGKDYT